LGLALSRREADGRLAIDDPAVGPAQEQRLVSLAYLAWPIAVYDRIAPREETSSWYRFQMRQALWFGNLAVVIAVVAFTWPLIVSFFATDITLVIWVYAVAMLIDTAIFVTWLVLAVRYSRRAAHGDLFDVPWVTRITGTRSQKP
jgi:uncharacterized Tic20 family protein